MLDRDRLETFAKVIEEGSFERAANILNVTRGAISQRIQSLEESMGVVLLLRDRPIVPTKAGVVLLRHVQALRLLEDATRAELMPSASAQRPVSLAIAVNADSLCTWFASVLQQLLSERFIALEVVVEDQNHTLARLLSGEVIGCISTEANPHTGFSAQALGAMEYRCFAAPTFAQRHFPGGLALQPALRAPAILFNRKDSLHDEFLAELLGFKVEHYPKHYLPEPTALLDGVLAGLGYSLLPTAQVRARSAQSRLVDLAPAHPLFVELYWHQWKMATPLAQEIALLVVREASRSLDRAPHAGRRTGEVLR